MSSAILEEVASILRRDVIGKTVFNKYRVTILRELCERNDLVVACSGKHSKSATKADYIEALLVHVSNFYVSIDMYHSYHIFSTENGQCQKMTFRWGKVKVYQWTKMCPRILVTETLGETTAGIRVGTN